MSLRRARKNASGNGDAPSHLTYNNSLDTKNERQNKSLQILAAALLVGACTLGVSINRAWFDKTTNPTLNTYNIRGGVSRHQQCSVWMAPSSLVGNAGFGIFITRDLEPGDSILGGPDGISVPIGQYLMHENNRKAPNAQAQKAWLDLWDNWIWGRGVPDHVSYEAPPDVVDYQINFGALPNHHCVLEQLDTRYPRPPYDDTMVERSAPGAGAFTYSRGREFLVSRKTRAGEEIFLNYGYCEHTGDPEWTDHIFMTGDFEEAASLILKNKLRYDQDGTLQEIPNGTSELAAKLLPKTKADLGHTMTGVRSQDDLVQSLAIRKSVDLKTPEWVKKHGMCLEHMVPVKSKIPQAGQGAFAQHPIRKGDIVVPAPLLQIVDKEALSIYDENGNRVGTQLVMNYCFGHRDVKMLLCPITNAALINHCSARTPGPCGSKGPNAIYQWASGWDAVSDKWRQRSIEDIAKETVHGLTFEIIATRYIAPGEEIFIDYGEEWEQAWADHVEKWVPPSPIPSFISAREANEQEGPIIDDLVSGDLRKTVDHPYLFTGCQYWPTRDDKDKIFRKRDAWKKRSDREILKQFSDDGAFYRYNDPSGYDKHVDISHWPCSVLKESSDGSYIVRIHPFPWGDPLPWEENGVPRLLRNYPRKSIHYFVKPFESDQFLEGAFRQRIGLRDELVPPHWK